MGFVRVTANCSIICAPHVPNFCQLLYLATGVARLLLSVFISSWERQNPYDESVVGLSPAHLCSPYGGGLSYRAFHERYTYLIIEKV